jgi:hypothetical protein
LAVDHKHAHDDRDVLACGIVAEYAEAADRAIQRKLNAIAEGLSNVMSQLAGEHPELLGDCDELRQAVGLEKRESVSVRRDVARSSPA